MQQAYLIPSHDCPLCPRLAAFRLENRENHPNFFNGPVPSFGDLQGRLAIAGLAPGLKGANRTGRPFTGDYAGLVLYESLLKNGFAKGVYQEKPDDGLTLQDCRIINSVRCVPPQNKPTPEEIKVCNRFIASELSAMPRLKIVIALGRIAHDAVLTARGLKKSAYAFGHGREHRLPDGLTLLDSYHCSRYNINTGALTQAMFDKVVAHAANIVKTT